MKSILLILTVFILPTALLAQQPHVRFSYDQNGNRIKREIVVYKPARTNDRDVLSGVLSERLNGIKTTGFKVYPNPSNDIFNIALDDFSLAGKSVIVLTDQLGKELYRSAVSHANTSISTKSFADGIYYIILTAYNKKEVVKIIKGTSDKN